MPEPEDPPGSGVMDTTCGETGASKESESGGAAEGGPSPETEQQVCAEADKPSGEAAQAVSDVKEQSGGSSDRGETTERADDVGAGDFETLFVEEITGALNTLTLQDMEVTKRLVSSTMKMVDLQDVSEEELLSFRNSVIEKAKDLSLIHI